MPAAIASIAARGPAVVAISTPSAGPVMNEISVVIESRAKAGRRWDSGVRAAIDWRATANAGSARKPPSRASDQQRPVGHGLRHRPEGDLGDRGEDQHGAQAAAVDQPAHHGCAQRAARW